MKRILIIDDAEFARLVLREMLLEHGYEVCGEAEDGLEGIEKFKQLRPDVTLCDIRMNGMRGEDCIRRILAEDKNASILICAAISAEEDVAPLLGLGVKGVIRKPVNVDELIGMVEKALEQSPQGGEYKMLLEERARAEGIEIKSVLDYCSAFQSISGLPMDDPKVDRQYLQKKGEGLLVGMCALVSAKVPLGQLNRLEQIFADMIR